MEMINKNGFSVYIKMHPKSLYDRLIKSKKKRPLLANKSPEDILNHITNHLAERELYYNQSKMIIEGESLNISKLSGTIKKLLYL
jgi:shikimate kinase